MTDKITAIVVAAGKGSRMNMSINKQYLDLCGKPVLAWTLENFENSPLISEIIIVAGVDEIEYCQTQVVDLYNFKKVVSIVAGGSTRQESVYNGLVAVDSPKIVLIHDGARPFLTPAIIEKTAETALSHKACTVAVPVKDTIKTSDSSGFISETLDRSILFSIQTPQGFDFQTIITAHKKALAESYVGTDDAVLVERLGIPTKLVDGSYFNLKITTPEDILFAKSIISANL